MATETTKSIATVTWEDTVSVENAQKKKQELLKAFNSSDRIHLDISQVEDLDISAVQLILAAQKEALLRISLLVLPSVPPVNLYILRVFCFTIIGKMMYNHYHGKPTYI